MVSTFLNLFGSLSLVLALFVPALWLAHKFIRPRRWLCHFALGFAILAFVCAKVHSTTYVNRIQLDRTEEFAAWQAQQEAARRAAKDSRAEDVAQIRFAEDAQDDFLDQAGMDEADLTYFEKINAPTEPAWKTEKKQRSVGASPDDALAGLIGAETSSDGMRTKTLDAVEAAAPVTLTADKLALVQRLDAANLQVTRLLMLLALVFVIIDYFRRANVYEEAYLPLRLPSAWLNAFTPIPAVLERPDPPRRSVTDELTWFTKRGDSFLYIGTEPLTDHVLPVDDRVDDDFIFESLWYGRASFAVDSTDRATRMLARFTELLAERRATRAKVAQTVHVVWDLHPSDHPDLLQSFSKLAGPAGFSLLICP